MENINGSNGQNKPKNIAPMLFLILAIVAIGGYFFTHNLKNNVDLGAAARTASLDALPSPDAIDPVLLRQAIDAAGENAETITVQTFGGKMKTMPFPKVAYVLGGVTSVPGSSLQDVWYTLNPQSGTWGQQGNGNWYTGDLYNDVRYFKNALWAFEQNSSGGTTHVMKSIDGISWTQASANPMYPAREGFMTMNYNNKLWLMGGWNNYTYVNNYYNDIYTSSDGASWSAATTAPWGARAFASAVSYLDKMWVFGGGSSSTTYHDVWTYDKATGTWAEFDNDPTMAGIQKAPWSARSHQLTAVYNGKIYMVGGVGNEVWSFNGTTWTQEANGPWPARVDGSLFSMNGLLMFTGGSNGTTAYNDQWAFDSKTGAWTQLASANWPARTKQAVATPPFTFGPYIPGCSSFTGFSTLIGLPCFVRTDLTTNITSTGATFNGTLLSGAPASVYFMYDPYYNHNPKTVWLTQSTNGAMSASVNTLKPNTKYRVNACAPDSVGSPYYACAFETIFTTLP